VYLDILMEIFDFLLSYSCTLNFELCLDIMFAQVAGMGGD
jgi:hypothetical protein